MYHTLPGSRFYVSSGLGSAKTVSNISNAEPPVVTANGHGFSNADEVLALVGWEDFNNSVFRVANVTTNSVELPGYDSTDTDLYPQGSDTGTLVPINGWIEIGQVLGVSSSGGDAKYEEVNPYEKRNGIRLPYGFAAAGLEFTLGFDPANAAQVSMLGSSRKLGKRAVKFLLPGSAYAYCYGTVSASELPMFENVLKRKVSISIDGWFTSFT
jgi:hypothetical protein